MKIFVRISALVLALLTTFSFTACGGTDASKNINVIALAGPTGMGMAKLMEDSANGDTSGNYTFNVSSAPDQVKAELIKGTVDIAAVPVNLASILYKKTDGAIKIAAVNTLGVLYVLENGNTINSVEDLRGKTIYATGQASTPEYILNYILSENGIDPQKDIEIIYKTEHSELAALLASGEIVMGMLPEPQVTVAMNGNADLRIALNLTDEWNKVSDGNLIQGCIVVSSDFAEKNPEALNKFLAEYKASIKYAKTNTYDAAKLIEKYGIVAKAPLAEKALPNCNITYIDGNAMKTDVNRFLEILLNADPLSVGGSLPDDNFYYIAE